MRRLRHNRFVALLATFALFLATSAYLAHGYSPDSPAHDYSHCDLCLQFTGTGGPAAVPALHAPVDTVGRALRLPDAQVAVSRPKLRAHQPRGPPGFDLI